MLREQLPIVVAVPEEDDEALLRFAAWEAVVHGSAVDLVLVAPDEPVGRAGAEDDAERHRRLADAVAHTEILAGPGVMVTGRIVRGAPVAAVLDAAEGCLGIAVRQRDALRLKRVIEEDDRPPGDPPIACVPTGWRPLAPDRRPVVVGVDDVDGSRGLIAHALEVARAHGTWLRVVHAWHLPQRYDDVIDAQIGHRWREDLRTALTEVVDRCQAPTRPRARVPVEIVVEHGHPADVVIDAARQAQTLVLQRNEARSGTEHVGRTSRTALHQCPCPVILLPAVRTVRPGQGAGSGRVAVGSSGTEGIRPGPQSEAGSTTSTGTAAWWTR